MTEWAPWDRLSELQRGLVRLQWTGGVERLWWRFTDGYAEWSDFLPFLAAQQPDPDPSSPP